MGRRTSSGRIGAPTFGGLLASNNTTITTDDDADIILDPTGTGRVLIEGNAQLNEESALRFADSDNTGYVGFKAAATVPSNVTWTLPTADGNNLEAIVTDGSGNLSFAAVGAIISNNTTDSNTHYPLLSTATTGVANAVRTTSGKLEFVPSTGTLEVDNLTVEGTMQADTIVETSSLVYKENIEPITDALDKITQLAGVKYNRKQTGLQESGLIAEQVSEILPELVSLDKDKNPNSVAYSRLTAYLIEAVKELKQQIDDLKR